MESTRRIFGRGFDKRDHRVVRIERVVQQNIVAAEFLEQILRLGGQPEFARDKGLELQIGMRRLLVNIEQARQIHRAVNGENLPGFQFKVSTQAFDNLRIGVRLYLQAHRIALAPVVQFGPH